MSRKKKRFGVLIRVSTERQAKRGESLRSQTQDIEDAVGQLGAVITKRYVGQEHGTAGHERKLFEQLLNDASRSRKPFDAVMVWDASRWSRDPVKGYEGLTILRDSGIEFYTLVTRHDLCRPDVLQQLAFTTVINSGQAAIQTQKSILNKIHRAQRGIPSAGSLPFGRIYDKTKGKWRLDKGKVAKIKDCADRYLDGEAMKDLAKEYGINLSTLHDVLTKRSGPYFVVRFQKKEFNIDSGDIKIKVPPLLDAKTRRAISSKVAANKTYSHGKNKHDYLFSRMVFCGVCHRAMSGQLNAGIRYYRRAPDCACFTGHVRADYLEDTVMRRLFDMLGNRQAVREAIERAQPDIGKLSKLQQRMKRHVANLKTIEEGRQRLLRRVVKGTIEEQHADAQLIELREREGKTQDQIAEVQALIERYPDPDALDNATRKYSKARIACLERDYSHMTHDQKRKLVETVFAGKTTNGLRMGIYVESIPEYVNKRPRHWSWSIQGILVPSWEQSGDTTMGEEHYAFDPEHDLMPNDFVTSSGSY